MNQILETLGKLKTQISQDWDYLDFDHKKKILEEYNTQINDQKNWNDHEKMSSLNSKKTSVEKEIEEFENLKEKIFSFYDLYEMAENDEDLEMQVEIENEISSIQKDLENLEIKFYLSGEFDKGNAFINIHPGAGGVESQDWASMLLRMYLRWAEIMHYDVEILNEEDGGEAGIKDATLLIKGDYAFGYLTSENGVHRLIRLSPFNAQNKRQTSFCGVSVSPDIDDTVDIVLEEKDLKIDTFRASGAGGQHVNKTSSAVRITHIPTGIVTTCQNERSQFQNKDFAMKMLKSKIYLYEKEKKDAEIAGKQLDKKAIQWGNQIRSYIFQPQTNVKDHRTKLEISNVQSVMDGNITPFITAYIKQIKNKKN